MKQLLLVVLLLVAWLPQKGESYVWTGEWLNNAGCGPCATNVTLANVYASCYPTGAMCMSEQPQLFANQTNSLPDYLVPVYDLTCTNNQPTSFMGHVMVLYSQRQIMLLGFFPLVERYYDCHTSEWVTIQSQVGVQIKNIHLDLAPNGLMVLGTTFVNSSNLLQFGSSSPVGTGTNGLLVLGNWSVADPDWYSKTSSQWFFSLDYTITVVSSKTQASRVVTITLVGGMNMVPCTNNALMRDAPTCLVLNRQIRSFAKPSVLPLNIASQWSATGLTWPVSLREQCEQLHVYSSLNIGMNAIKPQTSSTRAQSTAQPFMCVNPMQRLITPANSLEWNDLFPTIVTILVVTPSSSSSSSSSTVIPVPELSSSTVPSPVVPSLVVPSLVVPSLVVPSTVIVGVVSPSLVSPSLVSPSLVSPSVARPTSPSPEGINENNTVPITEPPKPMTTSIIVLIIILVTIVLVIVVSGVGFGVIRKNIKDKLEGSDIISINKQSCLYAFCCLKSGARGYIDSAYDLADQDRLEAGGDERQIILSESEQTPRVSMTEDTVVDRELKSGYLDAISNQLASEEFQLSRRAPAKTAPKTQEEDDNESLFM